MEFKSIDTLSITECCEQLNLRREDLPEALQDIIEPNERNQLLIEQLQSLLDKDKSAIESCRTIEQYEAYLSSWTDGLYRGYARNRIAQLMAEAEELAFYQENKDSISGCEAYLQRYPKGKFVSDAQSTLAQKKKARKTRNIILLVLLLIVAGIFAYSNYVPVSYVNVDDNAELNNLDSEISLDISTDAISSTITATSSEDWIDCRVSGKTATHINVSSDNISYSYSGGTRTITVSTDGEWQISTGTAGWGHTSISGNTITLRVDENTSSSSRTDYFVIKSGSKEKRINISQDGKPATRLSVSTENVSFGKDGGRRSITVSTNGEWRIGVGTASWAHTSISGNTITLRVDENNSGEERTDYFTVVAGDKDVRIDISQEGGPSAEINRIRQKHNVINGYSKGLQIEVEFDVSNMKGKRVTATALFYYGDNTTPLNSAWGGQVSISKSDTAPYTNTTFTMNLFIPYQNLNMAPGWSGNLSFDIVIKDSNGKKLARENNQSFTYSQGAWFY